MSTGYAGDPDVYPADVRLVDDGEPASAAFLGLCSQDLADRTANLNARLSLLSGNVATMGGAAPVASTSALEALDVSVMSTGDLRFVPGYGWYRLSKVSGDITSYGSSGNDRRPQFMLSDDGLGVWALARSDRLITLRVVPLASGLIPGAAATYDNARLEDYTPSAGDYIHSPFGATLQVTSGTDQPGVLVDLTQALASYRGFRILFAGIRLWPPGGHSALPEFMPRLGLWRADQDGADVYAPTPLSAAMAVDSSGNVVSYEVRHELNLTAVSSDESIIEYGHSYTLGIFSEGGTDSSGGTRVTGINLTIGL